ncbi:hypothetical protein [Rhodoplanes azumiensis]|uniref:Uncharacterized protein n=1 Tax=Rhodoplanes azumiensis TaxID=1897628 RepID=A0ABW5AF20_9BRAD
MSIARAPMPETVPETISETMSESEIVTPSDGAPGAPIRFDFARGGGARRECRAVCGDAGEQLALALVRYVCAGYMTASADCWDAAYACAEHAFGPIDGPSFVGRAGALVRALRTERRGGFAFFPASCAQVSGDEAELLGLVQAARAGDVAALDRALARVGGGGRCRGVLTAARALAVLLDRHARLTTGGVCGSPAATVGGPGIVN